MQNIEKRTNSSQYKPDVSLVLCKPRAVLHNDFCRRNFHPRGQSSNTFHIWKEPHLFQGNLPIITKKNEILSLILEFHTENLRHEMYFKNGKYMLPYMCRWHSIFDEESHCLVYVVIRISNSSIESRNNHLYS